MKLKFLLLFLLFPLSAFGQVTNLFSTVEVTDSLNQSGVSFTNNIAGRTIHSNAIIQTGRDFTNTFDGLLGVGTNVVSARLHIGVTNQTMIAFKIDVPASHQTNIAHVMTGATRTMLVNSNGYLHIPYNASFSQLDKAITFLDSTNFVSGIWTLNNGSNIVMQSTTLSASAAPGFYLDSDGIHGVTGAVTRTLILGPGISATTPGLIAVADKTSGLYNGTVGDWRMSIKGKDVSQWTTFATTKGARFLSYSNTVIGSGGVSIESILSSTATLTYGSIAAEAFEDQVISVTGARTNDSVVLGLPPNPVENVNYKAFVASNDFVTIRASNPNTAVAVTPTNATYRVTVIHF